MKTNQLKSGVILSYLQMFLGTVISMIYTPFMLKTLGQSEYGLYNLASSIVSYLSLLNFGFGSSYIRFYSQYKKNSEEDNISRLNSLFLITFSVMGLLALFGGLVLSQSTKLIFDEGLTTNELTRAKYLILILTANMSISFPVSIFTTYITSQERFVFQKLLNMIKTVISPLTMLPILLMGYKSIGMVVTTVIITLIADIINITYCLKHLKMKFLFKGLNFRVLYEVAGFSVFIALNSIIDQINWNIDKLLIGRFRGTVGVAVYGVASQLNNLYLNFSTSISSVFTPRIHTIVAKNEPSRVITELFTKVGRIQFMILALISSGLVVFGKSFINLWAGTDYGESYYIALLLILPVTIPLIQNLGIEIQRAYNKHKFRSLLYAVMALLNIVLSIPLCIFFGGIGAAIGTAISLIIANGVIMNLYYHNELHIDIKYFWVQILKFAPALIAPFVTGFLLSTYIDCYKIVNLLICIVVYTIIYAVSMWLVGMNKYEKDLLRKPLSKIRGKL
jgi:Membrane protein involved in the export of O-antigen and teichoic acid